MNSGLFKASVALFLAYAGTGIVTYFAIDEYIEVKGYLAGTKAAPHVIAAILAIVLGMIVAAFLNSTSISDTIRRFKKEWQTIGDLDEIESEVVTAFYVAMAATLRRGAHELCELIGSVPGNSRGITYEMFVHESKDELLKTVASTKQPSNLENQMEFSLEGIHGEGAPGAAYILRSQVCCDTQKNLIYPANDKVGFSQVLLLDNLRKANPRILWTMSRPIMYMTEREPMGGRVLGTLSVDTTDPQGQATFDRPDVGKFLNGVAEDVSQLMRAHTKLSEIRENIRKRL